MNDFPGTGLYDRARAEYTAPAAESRYVIPRFVERTSQGVRDGTTRTRSSSRSA